MTVLQYLRVKDFTTLFHYKRLTIFILSGFLVTLYFFSLLNAQSIGNLVIPQYFFNIESLPDSVSFVSFSSHYYDYYHIFDTSGMKHYLYKSAHSISSQIVADRYGFSLMKLWNDSHYYINNLDNPDDFISVWCTYPEYRFTAYYKHNVKKFSASLIHTSAAGGSISFEIPVYRYRLSVISSYIPRDFQFKYFIKDDGHLIPFSYGINTNSIQLLNERSRIHFSFTSIIPAQSTGDFSSDTKGFSTSALLETARIQLDVSYTELSARLSYKHQEYGLLDRMRVFTYTAAPRIPITHSLSLAAGATGCSTWSGDDGYLDIWPLHRMDILLQSRTRLKRCSTQLHLPFLSLSYTHSQKKSSVETVYHLNIGYYHLLQKNNIIYKERYPVLFPILYAYRTKTLAISPDADALVALQGDSFWRIQRFAVSASIRQVIPVDYKKVSVGHIAREGNGQPVVKEKRRGGTFAELSIMYIF